jgi:hypothetical protein
MHTHETVDAARRTLSQIPWPLPKSGDKRRVAIAQIFELKTQLIPHSRIKSDPTCPYCIMYTRHELFKFIERYDSQPKPETYGGQTV